MRLEICIFVALSAAALGAKYRESPPRTITDDIEFALYNTKKVTFDLDVLEARTSILALELTYTVSDLVLDIEKLLRELLFPSDAERVIGEINKTAESVLTNVVRLDDIIIRLDGSVALVENDLINNLDSLKSDKLLLESYITNFNLTYDIGKENVILGTNYIVLILETELEGLTDPEVDIIKRLSNQIKDVLLEEQGYLDNARLSFDGNAVSLLAAVTTVVDLLPTLSSTTVITSTAPPATKMTTTPPSTTMSLIPTTSTTSTTAGPSSTTETTRTMVTVTTPASPTPTSE